MIIEAQAARVLAGRTNERTIAHCCGERVAFRVLPGRGPRAVVGLHGLGSRKEDLEGVLRQAGGPAVVLDLPGFGASDRPDRAYPVRRAVAATLAVLDEAGVESPVWFGCSYGGHVALRAAIDHPGRVGGLVLASSGGLDPDPPVSLAAAFDERVLSGRSVDAVRAALAALVGRPNAATARFAARRLVAHAQGDYRAIARSAVGALEDDAARHLEGVRCAVEIVHGERDPLVPMALARAAAGRFPRAMLTVLEGVGHMPWLEAPGEVAGRVRDGLQRL